VLYANKFHKQISPRSLTNFTLVKFEIDEQKRTGLYPYKYALGRLYFRLCRVRSTFTVQYVVVTLVTHVTKNAVAKKRYALRVR
jgi:hypothetical protein